MGRHHLGRTAPRRRVPGRVSRVPALVGVLVGLLLAGVVATPAIAFWRATGTGSGTGSTTTLNPPTGVTAPASSPTTVPVSWTASTGIPAPSGYYVLRTSSGGTSAACGSSATSLITGTSCSDTGVAAGTYTYRVVAVYRSWTATSAASGSVTVTAATKLAFTVQPTSAVATQAISPSPQVTVQDSAGNAVAGAGRTITVALGTNPAAGTLSGTATATTNAAGVATFAGLSIDKAGTGYTLTAASTGLTSATSSAFAITVGVASKLAFTTSPDTSFTGRAFYTQPVVTVQDAGGNTVTSSTATITLALSPATATLGCTTKAAVAGVAAFTGCSVSAVGTYSLTATSGALTAATSGSFQVVAAPTALLWSGYSATVCSGPTGTAASLTYTFCLNVLGNGTFTSRVQLSDSAGNAVVNVGPDITVTLTTANGTATPTTLTIPHGASVTSATTSFTPVYLLNTSSTVTAGSTGLASAVAALRSLT
ncbi:fibronectin type III domain-containing protein [Actinokineospora bangkokensis]|uniref:Fibronectin type-III domain-containing protein n=1 Tax=Actinokineospora bangkokensis TaxID=1193682 RepID=A0A1Q9LIZ3_9PSEU|nr:fibronectin type III domain-containing protein [Actinokineospora bangkokensis]OLR91964.1 hypothetical protein BJP25_24405 [Actinokineospora bangkokensis]